MSTLYCDYYFYAVGQGLFSGGLIVHTQSKNQFNWVYDCGTVSSQKYLEREIDKFRSMQVSSKSVIDMVCISHFDKDHISGLKHLVGNHHIRALVIPYVSIIDRIQMALRADDLTHEEFRFLADPVDFILAAQGTIGRVERIFIVVGGEAPDSDRAILSIDDGPKDQRGEPWSFLAHDNPPNNEPVEGDAYGIGNANPQGNVHVITHKYSFTVGNLWEFFFYNKNFPNVDLKKLTENVISIIKSYRRGNGVYDIQNLIDRLKGEYDFAFNGIDDQRNAISLICYGGLLRPHAESCAGISESSNEMISKPRHGIVYCGDYPLVDLNELLEIKRHYTSDWKERWDNFLVMQVPHHGSRHNWFSGAAANFNHRYSVISARQSSAKHPAACVLADLSGSKICLVNEYVGCHIQRQIFL